MAASCWISLASRVAVPVPRPDRNPWSTLFHLTLCCRNFDFGILVFGVKIYPWQQWRMNTFGGYTTLTSSSLTNTYNKNLGMTWLSVLTSIVTFRQPFGIGDCTTYIWRNTQIYRDLLTCTYICLSPLCFGILDYNKLSAIVALCFVFIALNLWTDVFCLTFNSS